MNPRSWWRRAYRRFVLVPAGFGRPTDAVVMDREYVRGAWDFAAPSEQPRQEAIADEAAALHPCPSILDVGCGSGTLAQRLLHRPARGYVGLDLSPEALRRARALNLDGAEFVAGDFETWSPDARFDLVILSECLGYAHDPAVLVRRSLGWLEPGGYVIVSLFRSESWAARWRRVDRVAATVRAQVVAGAEGRVWDVRVLRPLPP